MKVLFRPHSALLATALLLVPVALVAQSANSTQAGTVKSVAGSMVVVTTDSKTDLTVTPEDGARLVQLAPGSKDLKAATPVALTDLAPGDRVLVTGHPGATPTAVAATRIIVMKAAAVADLHASQSADWQRRGTGGLVKSISGPDINVNNPGRTILVSTGARTIDVVTSASTIFRRYAGDSVKFEDARPGTLADIHPGDQLRVRGSLDGNTVAAEEIVSGSFQNIAGVLTAVDPAAGTISLRDLATKKTVTIHVTGNSELHALPPEMAQRYARAHTSGATQAGGPPATRPGNPGGAPGAGQGASSGTGPGATDEPSRPRRAPDLSQMVNRLPQGSLADLKAGQAVLLVASQSGTGSLTAVTLLSGVEPILTASPSGAAPTLSPWSIGSGGGEGEGGGA